MTAAPVPPGAQQAPAGGVPHSLSRQIAATTSLIIVAFVLCVAGASWWLLHRQQVAAAHELTGKQVELVATRTAARLSNIQEQMQKAARSSLISTALVDTVGKDAYLVPYLQGFRQIDGIPVAVLFADFEGKEIDRNGAPGISAAHLEWLSRQLASPTPQAVTVFGQGDAAELVGAEFVYYSRTRTPEGAVLYRVRLSDVVDPGVRLHWSGQPAPAGNRFVAPLELPATLQPLGFALSMPEAAVASVRPDLRVALLFALGTLALCGVAVFFGRYVADHVTRELRELVRFAGEVAVPDSGDQRIGLAGTREVAELGTAMNAMLDRLQESHESLRTRTMELEAAVDAAKAANRAKSAFLSTMSHELRTPLNGILGMTGLALRQTTDAKLRERLGKIDQASQHLLGVINDVLDISRIEAERLTLEQVNFQLGKVLDNVLNLVRTRAASKGLALRTEVDPALTELHFVGDPVRLGQVFINLVGNAVKFTDMGSVTLRASVLEDRQHHIVLRCEVTDTGIGISAADQARLFSAFEQADSSLTRKYGGTGLGLTICKRLVERMQGQIGLESTPGDGSTFWFTVRLAKGVVPQTRRVATGPSAEARLHQEFAGTRLLLVEDEPMNRETTRELLESCGLKVDVAQDGAEAVDKAAQGPYTLILMDMQMPTMNGLDATRAIRRDSVNRSTPILAMTANAFEEDRRMCLEAGMNDFIAKPIEPEALFKRILSWLELAQQQGAGLELI